VVFPAPVANFNAMRISSWPPIDIRPFFCQIEAVETAIWLTEVAPKMGANGRSADVLRRLGLGIGVMNSAIPTVFNYFLGVLVRGIKDGLFEEVVSLLAFPPSEPISFFGHSTKLLERFCSQTMKFSSRKSNIK
jgi:hypothetical protein